MNQSNENAEDALPILRAYAIATSGGIQLPSRMYLDELADILDVSIRKAREIADNYKKTNYRPVNFNLKQSGDLYLGMYNATLDAGRVLNLLQLKERVVGNGFTPKRFGVYTIKAVRMTLRYGRFKKAFEYTKEYGARNLSNVSNDRVSSLELIVKIKKGSKIQGASVSIFNTGRVRLSGGYIDGSSGEPVSLIRYVDELTGLNLASKSIKLNNITGEIKLGARIDLQQLYTLLDVTKGLAKFDDMVIEATFEPARNAFLAKEKKDSPFLYIKFGDKFTLLIANNGTIIVEGKEEPQKTSKVIRRFVDFIKTAGILTPKNGNLRPNPKPSKLARRMNNMPAPDVTRRGTTCPVGKRPVPYSFQGKCPQGDGYYVRPNPQGQPCCYQIPKRPGYLRNKVAERYARANVKVPESVRKIFGIGMNTNNKSNNVGKNAPVNMNFTHNKKVGFKIGSRQCLRYTKVGLIDLATRMGMSVPSVISKPKLCEMIATFVKKNGKNSGFILNGKVCTTYKKSTLVKYARELGVTTLGGTKEELCKDIKKASNKLMNTPVNDANFDYFMNLARKLKNK
jgi:hypothetical protein